ncbi:MAG TPA: hypothetical protein VEM96_17495 [Pyrinomonadaceae bacterium]|nr:hypothetical protein [Pyrinomonadaceae bacterium]
MNLRIPHAKVYFPEEDREAILRQIDDALASGQLTLGKKVTSFEQCFAENFVETGMMKTVEWFKRKYQNGKAALAAAS